jgi:hypothetical protein
MKLSLIVSALCFSSIALASPTRGTLVVSRELDPRQGVMYSVELKGGEKTTIDAHGTNVGGNIDCVLYKDADAVAEDINAKDSCHMEYTPSTTSVFVLVVVNKGSISNKLTLTVQ